MLNLLNFSLPVLIFFLFNLVLIFIIYSFFSKSKISFIKCLIFIIIFTLLLQLLYNRKFVVTIWLLILSPFIIIVLLFLLYIFFIFKLKGKFELRSLFNIFKLIKTMFTYKFSSIRF